MQAGSVARALAALIGVACAAGTAPPGGDAEHPIEPGSGERIALRFAWPVPLRVEVETVWERSRRREEVAQERRGLVRQELRAHRAAEGLLVQIRQREASAAPDAGGSLEARVAALAPDFVVSPEGDFLRVVGTERLRDELRLFLRELFAIGPVDLDTEALIDELTDPEVLEARAAGEWNWLVGAWSGGDLEVGAVYAYDEIGASSADLIATRHRFSLHGRTACTGGVGDDCVELAIRSESGPRDSTSPMAGVADTSGPQAPARDGLGLDEEAGMPSVVTEVRLVTEPGTLLPHRFEQTRVTTGHEPGRGGLAAYEQREQKVVRYRYPEGSGR